MADDVLVPAVAEEFDFPAQFPLVDVGAVERLEEPPEVLPMPADMRPDLAEVPDLLPMPPDMVPPTTARDAVEQLPFVGGLLAGEDVAAARGRQEVVPTEQPSTPAEPAPVVAEPVSPEEKIRQDSRAYLDLGRRRGELVSAVGNLDARIASTTDPAARAQLQQERAGLVSTLGTVGQEQDAARQRQELGTAELQERAEAAKADAALTVAQAQAEEGARIAARTRAEQDRIAMREEAARREHEKARREYQAVLKGPAQAQMVAGTLGEMLSESFQAAVDNRVPRFGAILDRAWKRDRAALADARQAAADNVGLTGDRVADLAARRRAVLAEEEVQRAAFMREVADRAALTVQRAVTPLEKARAANVYSQLQQQAEQADARAAQARSEALRRAEQDEMKRAMDRAKLAKMGAEARKTTAEAAKLERKLRGTGRGRRPSGLLPGPIRAAVAAGTISKSEGQRVFKQGVQDPATGAPLRRSDGTFAIAPDAKTANTLNEAIAITATSNDLINEALALRGAKGWEPTTRFWSSEAGKRMAALSTQMLLLNKEAFGLGVLSESDENLLKRVQGGDLSGMQDPRPALRDLQRRTESALNQRLRSLVPGAPGLSFRRVREAPKATPENLRKRLVQAPRLDSRKVVPSARDRIADVEQLRDLHIGAAGNDVAAGAQAFADDMRNIIKRGEAQADTILEAVREATPEGYDSAQLEMLRAGAVLESVKQDADATGAELEKANSDLQKARAAVRKLESPRYRRLLDAQEQQRLYLKRARRMVESDVGTLRAREATKRAQQAEVTERFEAGRAISGARGF